MDFVVVTQPRQDRCRWPYGKVHLMVSDSEVTLCAESASRFVRADPVPAEDVDCELCRLTACT